MRALLCRELGNINNLEFGEIAAPVLDPDRSDQVRIRVHASGVNFPDILMVEGKYQVKPALPFVPGLEVAGEVIECAPGVSHVHPGDRVIAFARHGGGHAEQIVVPGAIVTPLPDALDYASAAAFPIAFGTAHFALTHRGQLSAGQTLLVLGAAGGVGLAAIKVGKFLGATVIATASSADKLKVASAAGADYTINYQAEALRDRVLALTDGKGCDLVFDPVGGTAFEQCVRCIGWEGRILIIGFASGDIPRVATNMILVKNFSVTGVVFGEHSARYPEESRARFESLLDAVTSGALIIEPPAVFALSNGVAALDEMANRRVIGKIVLTPDQGKPTIVRSTQ
ncbi:MAG: NADPH:quinone oxidoreductase family protein [Burkholderiaceae bacterium]